MDIKKLFATLNRVIAVLSGILLVIILCMLMFMYGGGLKVLVSDKSKNTNAFRDYDVQKNYGRGYYMVEFKDLITSAGGMEKRYYRYDLTLETEDKRSAEDVLDMRTQVITIINGVMSTFPPDEMNTEAERSRVKSIIQSEVTGHYPSIKVKDVFFTNFLYD